ncbi:MAG: hypothetical protein WC964_02455 [Acholeplasmataceae bacterium]
MKKIAKIFVLLILIVIGIEKTYAISPVLVNELDLSSMVVYNHDNYIVSTKPISVKPNQTYTIVLGYSFIGPYEYYIETDSYLFIETEMEELELLAVKDANKRVAYYEFSVLANQIDYIKIPYYQYDYLYEMMMYEGTYDLFDQFVLYQKNEETEENGSIEVDIDNPIIPSDLKTLVKAQNELGYNIQTNIICDEYTENYQKIGNYLVVYEALYNSKIKRFILNINVKDITAPIIELAEEMVVSIDEKKSISEIIEKITVYDNVDELSHQDLIILEDTYSEAIDVGDYHLLVKAIDLSGNESTLNIPIYLVDITPPVITGVSEVFIYRSDDPLTNEQLKEKINVTDNSGEEISLSITMNTYGQTRIPGRYQVRFEAKDIYQNKTVFNMFIHVIEDRGPTFKLDELVLRTTSNSHLDEDELIAFFRNKLNEKDLYPTNLNISYNEYSGNENKEGSYYVYFDYELNNRTESEKILITVTKQQPQISLYIYLGLSVLLVGIGFLGVKRYFRLRKHKRN